MRDTRPPYDAALAERVRRRMVLIPLEDDADAEPLRGARQAPSAEPPDGRQVAAAD